ncbi:MAG: hypothetical protein GF372_12240 [Candidatus Marinimicrobia bacterium]|nr:hypothetical protein [Candidatus Neomarinimicrobiota bacterium]
MSYPNVTIDFERHLREWDGFGVNYVETSQTRDYSEWSQDYGGFSQLSESERQEIIKLIFGEDGLKPGITKMFLDIWHEGDTIKDNDNKDPWKLNMKRFNHEETTEWMRYFNREGLKTTRARGGDLKTLTTLYGPPQWATMQGYVNGRDLDPAMREELAEYMVSWVKYLREEANLPVVALSMHNEGDAYYRWPPDGDGPGLDEEDYNMYWPAEQVVTMMPIVRKMLNHHDLDDVMLTPGETQTWSRFHMWGFAPGILADKSALNSLGLISSHSFAVYDAMDSRFYGDWRSNGNDMLRLGKAESMDEVEDLHSWVMSMSWGQMDAHFIDAVRRNIYMTKVNAVTPWAIIQRPTQWKGGDPNPRTAFHVTEDGEFQILKGYYTYKQVTRAGQPGMAVAHVESLDPAVNAIAFAANGTDNTDAFVLVNIAEDSKDTQITLRNTSNGTFTAYRTTDNEDYKSIGKFEVTDGVLRYEAPAESVTTFFME